MLWFLLHKSVLAESVLDGPARVAMDYDIPGRLEGRRKLMATLRVRRDFILRTTLGKKALRVQREGVS